MNDRAETFGGQAAPASRHGEAPARPTLGFVEWFWPGDRKHAERMLAQMRRLGVTDLRTGLSWADWHTPWGDEWFSWLLPRLAREVRVLPCCLYTPPSLGIAPKSSSPPRNPKDFADFVDLMITRFGNCFEYVELWNEPANRVDWDWTKDPRWWIFAEMVGGAAYRARQRGKKTVLAGMSPIDPHWLQLMIERGVLRDIDVVGLHGFPGTHEVDWEGWVKHVADIRKELQDAGSNAQVWITEVGFSTWRHDTHGQLRCFLDAAAAPVERVYWYSMYDLDPALPTVEGFHVDERDYHFGIKHVNDTPKLLFRTWEAGGIDAVTNVGRVRSYDPAASRRGVLITGGAGFIGTNLARRILDMGRNVIIFDNLSRPGVEDNLAWLKESYRDQVSAEIGDVRDRFALRRVLQNAEQVFHLAAQAAVTASLGDPMLDAEINLLGTLNLLEEIRALAARPGLVFTSTNKVYGGLEDIPLAEEDKRYTPADHGLRTCGIGEKRPVSFSSPYGCSKGAADQYVLDYARSFGLRTIVLRMSCIYGPHQAGSVGQGWVAHFIDRAVKGEPIVLYGNGKQVRDILFIDDLVDALLAAEANLRMLSGQAFNIGGGPYNTISLLELIDLIAELRHEPPIIDFADWRSGDQRYYVSDASRFRIATGWRPKVGVRPGVQRLYEWLLEKERVPAALIPGGSTR